MTDEEARKIIHGFLDMGSGLVDLPNRNPDYHSETLIGEELRRRTYSRDDLILSLASGYRPHAPAGFRIDCSRRSLLQQLDTSLRCLGTDFVDIWTIAYWDEHTPLTELWATMHYVLNSGRARYVAVHGFHGWQLALISAQTSESIACQSEYSLLQRNAEAELWPAAHYLQSGMIATRPLALGALAQPWRKLSPQPEAHPYLNDRAHTILDALETAAEGLGSTLATTALSWVKDQPGMSTCLVGVSKEDQLISVQEAGEQKLPRQILAALDDVSQ
ncbi:aldo/keto reductase [Corynebacterium sp. 3HC-13]|nr:aldo/keto reductase [Corynebacterium poyangense]